MTALTVDVDAVVAEVVDAALERCSRRAAAFGRHYLLVWSEIARSVRGGKRFRSALVLRTHAALGGDVPAAAAQVGAAFEMLHTGFLIHDDLIDGDTVRRGEPNLAATVRADALASAHPEQAGRWSDAAAVLAGDLALAQAHRLLAGAEVPADRRTALLDLLDETLLVSAGGELADTAFGLGLHEPTLAESLRVAESKTAMYSFRAPLRAGALLAGASPRVVGALDAHGRLLGRSFQLVDDLLGVFGPESETGKSSISDLREGKRTPLVLHAAGLPVWPELAEGFGRADLAEPTATRMRQALARSEAPSLVRDTVLADLAEVAGRLPQEGLPAPMVEVVAGVAAQIRTALAGAMDHVEAAR